MYFHHDPHPDTPECYVCRDWPMYARHLLHQLHRLESKMSELSSNQQQLDADVQALNDGIAAVEAELASLQNQPAADSVDFSGLEAAVARLKGDAPAPPTP